MDAIIMLEERRPSQFIETIRAGIKTVQNVLPKEKFVQEVEVIVQTSKELYLTLVINANKFPLHDLREICHSITIAIGYLKMAQLSHPGLSYTRIREAERHFNKISPLLQPAKAQAA